MDEAPSGPAAAATRLEPRRATIADLILLSAGSAVALSLGPNRRFMTGLLGGEWSSSPFPPPILLLSVAATLLAYSAAGVAAVVVARCLRHRRLPGASEWWPLLIALGISARSALLGVAMLGGPVRDRPRADILAWVAIFLALTVCLAATLRPARLDRSRARLVVLMLSGLAVFWVQILIDSLTYRAMPALPLNTFPGPADTLRLAVRSIVGLPTSLLYAASALVTWLRWRRTRLAGATWTEWAGVGLMIAWAGYWLAMTAVSIASYGAAAASSSLLIFGLREPLALLLAWALLNRLGPTWGRWFGP